ncbi:MAG: SdrD B-like domain-containing protein, partial [Acidobacteriota bacterium]
MSRPALASPRRGWVFEVTTLAAVACVFLGLLPTASSAATLPVNGVTCTLADAIVAANTDTAAGGCPAGDPGADTLQLNADVTLSSADASSTAHSGVRAGLPDVTDDLTIAAGAAATIRRDPAFSCNASTADPVFRFLNLESGALTLDGVTLEGGCFVAGGEDNQGGGLWAALDTELTLSGVTVSGFDAISTGGPLNGGFLFSAGERVTVTDAVFDDMSIQAAGTLRGGVIYLGDTLTGAEIDGASFSNITVQSDLASLQGGVIYTRTQLTVEDASFSHLAMSSDSSLQGGGLYAAGANVAVVERSSFDQVTVISNSSLQGGALYGSNQDFRVADVIIANVDAEATNTCTGGALYANSGGPFERLIVEDNVCRSFTSGVEGAGARLLASDTVLRDCVFRRNESRAHSSARGGALFAGNLALIERCAFLDNRAISEASTGSLDARGGALQIGRIDSMRNVTIAGNLAHAADGAGLAADGGTAEGGGLSLTSGGQTSVLSAVTVTHNRAVAGVGDAGFLDGDALGGGLFVGNDHAVQIIGSILSHNSTTDAFGDAAPDDCFAEGTVASSGFNVVLDPHPSCLFDAFGDVIGLDPELYPAADYGCAVPLLDGSCVPTAAIDQNSWAIDWASCADAGIGLDGRRLDRRQDIVGVLNLTPDACDAGAYEARDSDGDGVTDLPDLCPLASDPDQADADGDLVGDACDACLGDDATGDADGDFVCDDSDLCAGSDDLTDVDGDGAPDGCDVCLGDDATGDADGDGRCDDRDTAVGDRVWLDDGNGIQDGGEPGVAAVTVHLYAADGQRLDTVATDGDGRYSFSPGPGSFYLEFAPPPGLTFAPRDQGVDESVDSDPNSTSGTTSIFNLAPGQN